MKVNCTQRELSKGVSIVQRAVASRTTLAILGNILLEAKDGQLRLSTTNLSVSINCWVRADVQEEGAITVPARLFGDMVGKLLPGRVELALDSRIKQLHLTCGGFKAKLSGLDAESFPQTLTPLADAIALNVKQVAEMIDQVAFVASRDESRPALCCVKVDFGARLTMVGCDGFRLGVRSFPLETAAPERSVLVPAISMAELGSILTDADPDKPLWVGGDERRIVFAVEGKDSYLRAELSAQLTDAKYPDYHAIIPKSSTTSIAVDNVAFLRSLQTANLFAKGDERAVAIAANPGGCLQVSAKDDVMGRSDDALDAEIKGVAVAASLNIGFLLEVIGRLGKTQVVIEMTTASRPITVRPFFASPDEFVHVIMPMNREKK